VSRDYDDENRSYTLVILKKGDKIQGVVVDSLVGQYEIVIKSLGKLFSSLRIIAGATILGDGNLALILDVNYIE
jgi:two-component system chemotaxis sensor kinase CheA